MENFLVGYPVVIETTIAWGEMDAFQHLNNVVYFRYFENARIAYFDRLDLMDMVTGTGIGPILASTSCRFKIPLQYPDKLLIGAKVTHIGEDRFTMGHCVFSTTHQKVAAEGDALVVTFNYRENKKAPIPDELRKLILDLQGTV
jgi:acyl-CoA thioester hydrolase